MRACVVALVFLLFAFAHTQMGALAQGTQQQDATTPKAEVVDLAEQLVAQAEKWFETLGAQGKMPRVFSGITRDARQLIIELDSLPFDQVKGREFLIWLGQRYDLVAYAYATRVMQQAAGRDDPVEALDIYASSFDKDVFARLALTRQPDGSIRYSRDEYLSMQRSNRT